MTTAPHLPPCPWPIVDRESLAIAVDYAIDRLLLDERAAAEWVLRKCGFERERGRVSEFWSRGNCTLSLSRQWFQLRDKPAERANPHETLLAFVVRAICEIRGWHD